MKKNQLSERESRYLAEPIEIRAGGEGEESRTVFGYAAKFNVESENLGTKNFQIRETIAPGAFDNVLNDDVRALFNHSDNLILARSRNGEGSLKLGVDDVGLFYEFEAPDTQAGRDLLTSIKRGDVDQSSFSFSVADDGQTWEEKQEGDGLVISRRTITKVSRLYDVSPVTFPAYPDATVAMRSLEQFRKEHSEETEPEETRSDEPTPEQISEVADWAARFGINPAQTNETNDN